MKCGQCGTQNPQEASFCLACGSHLVSGTPRRDQVWEENEATLRDPRVDARSRRRAPLAPLNPLTELPSARTDFRLIFVHPDGSEGTTYLLHGTQIDIGRTEGSLLFDDPYLSPRHARITSGVEGHILIGLGSRNGIYMRLRAGVDLQEGDLILVGKQVLCFERIPDFERDLRPAVRHNMVLFGSQGLSAWGRLRQLGPTGVSHDVFHFGREEVVIGRETGNIVFSDDRFMSRRHARLSLRGNVGHLEDLGSSNGTFVRLREGPRLLVPGDFIRMGNVLLRFEHA